MTKMKTKKALEKKIKITSSGKILRRHQFSMGKFKRKKSKGALEKAKKTMLFAKGDLKNVKKMLGI